MVHKRERPTAISYEPDDICLAAKVPECGCVVGVSLIPQYVGGEGAIQTYIDKVVRADAAEWVANGLTVELADSSTAASALCLCLTRIYIRQSHRLKYPLLKYWSR